jgi:hypothetical protein
MFVGLAAIVTLGCHDSTGSAPPIGAIEITVATAGAVADIDPDGYTLSIDDAPGQAVGVNATVTIGRLQLGTHFVRLTGLAPNCAISGSYPRAVNVTADNAAPSVSFSVSCSSAPGPWDY